MQHLQATSRHLVQSGLRTTTRKTYSSAQKSYMKFCDDYNLLALPCSEDTVLLFIAYLHSTGCKGSTIRVYLSAVRSLHVEEGYGNPMDNYLRVKQALRASDRISPNPTRKMPITLDILSKMHSLIGSSTRDKMIWAAFTLSFFGCLRAAEVTISDKFRPSADLCREDVTFIDNIDDPFMSIHIKTSKTDKTSLGFNVIVACVPHTACAYCAMSTYLSTQKLSSKDALFQSNGTHLTRTLFQKLVKLYISALGYSSTNYSGHSFRSGCATSAAAAGMLDWEIKLLGRWASDTYQRYIRAPNGMLAQLTHRIINQPCPSLHHAKSYVSNAICHVSASVKCFIPIFFFNHYFKFQLFVTLFIITFITGPCIMGIQRPYINSSVHLR